MKIFVLIVFKKNLSRHDIANINDFISNNLQHCHPEREAVEGSLFYLNTIIKILTQIVRITQILDFYLMKIFVLMYLKNLSHLL